jgi:hypothetical protein
MFLLYLSQLQPREFERLACHDTPTQLNVFGCQKSVEKRPEILLVPSVFRQGN